MKRRLNIFLILVAALVNLYAQSDTIVVKDFAKILITINQKDVIEPVTDYSKIREAGFFLNERPREDLKVCNDSEIFVWLNGKMITSVVGCKYLSPEELFKNDESDTTYISFSATSSFENFSCELVRYEDERVLREEVSIARSVRDIFREFTIIAIITLLAGFGLFAVSFPSRLNFLVSKTFSLKASAYEFTNTKFFSRANLFLIFIISLTVSFEVIYINEKANEAIFQSPISFSDYLLSWGIIAVWFVLFYLGKRVLITIVAGLFKMRKLRDWQMFDLVNFTGYFVLILFLVILWDYILKSAGDSWIIPYFSYYFLLVLFLFGVWFVIKFVINSSYQKLLIISYLCATELIPSIFIMVWFFK